MSRLIISQVFFMMMMMKRHYKQHLHLQYTTMQ